MVRLDQKKCEERKKSVVI